jgi:hypothetical protein
VKYWEIIADNLSNTGSRVYHKDASRFYGKTKKGKYVSEADAIKEGDRAAARGQ